MALPDNEWRPRTVWLPRFGLMISRNGAQSRLILPGEYLVRRSRSLGRWIYRRH